MKAKETEKLLRKLLPHLPGFAVKGRLLFLCPIHHLLRGLSLSPSGFDKSTFYVECFIQPLYVPKEYIVLSVGKRLGGGGWDYRPDTESELINRLLVVIAQEGVPFLRSAESPLQYAELASQTSGPNNPHVLQAKAYALVLADRPAEALEVLARLRESINNSTDTRDWLQDILRQANEFEELLIQSPEKAKEQLHKWEAYTLNNLRLRKFAESC
jgi:hypothetical protein